jgi:putative nucleotidyltransferase with HDIG domain
MVEENKGIVVLTKVPPLEARDRISVFLSSFLSTDPGDSLSSSLEKAPCVLITNVPATTGQLFVKELYKLGAQAIYHGGNGTPGETPVEQCPTGPINASRQEDFDVAAQAEELFAPERKLPQASTTSKIGRVAEVNKELWLILSMLLIVGIMNYLLTSQRVLLGLYTLPTLFSAYYYGRRHATLTAFASILLVGIAMYYNPAMLLETESPFGGEAQWFEITAWGSILVITAYAMGTLYERNTSQLKELRSTYYGLLMILRQFISQDKYTENHSYRVSIYAARIATNYGCNSQQVEDIRAAALMHDIGKLDISRDLLYKAARFTQAEYEKMKQHVSKGVNMLEPLEGPLGRVIPIILSHHDKYDGSGYHPAQGQEIPLEARILSVADVYDSLTSDRPYRKAMSPWEAKDIIVEQSGSEFDPSVVKAFLKAFKRGQLEIPSVVV